MLYSLSLINDSILHIAYVGPGAGLTMLGALAAVLGVLLLAILAPLLYPIHVLRNWLRRRRTAVAAGMLAPSSLLGSLESKMIASHVIDQPVSNDEQTAC